MKKLFLPFLLLALLPFGSFAQYVSLDSSYGTNGVELTNFALDIAEGREIKVLADGKILIAGFDYRTTSSTFAITKQNSDGSLDNSFNGTGKQTIAFSGFSYSYGKTIALTTDGKIVFGGSIFNGSDYDFALTRLNANGSIDSTFGSNGYVVLNINSENDELNVLAIDTVGRIYGAGYTFSNFQKEMVVVRFLANGSIDSTFGSNGIAELNISSGDDVVNSIKIQTDGKIILAGNSNSIPSYLTVVRLDSNGFLDFATTLPYSSQGQGVDIQNDSKIVVAGSAVGVAAVFRFNTDGSVDSLFGNNGRALNFISTTSIDAGWSVLVDANNKILVGGNAYEPGTPRLTTLYRFNSDGSKDTTFGPDASFAIPLTIGDNGVIGMALQSDGKLIVTGRGNTNIMNTTAVFCNARFIITAGGSVPVSVVEPITNQWAIYPNPVKDYLSIEMEEAAELEIYSINGRLMDRLTAEPFQRINTADYAPGVYLIKTGNSVQKFIKE